MTAHPGDVIQGLTAHQQPGHLRHPLAQDNRGHNVTDGLCLSLGPAQASVTELRACLYNLLNIQQTQTITISYDHRSCAPITHLCPASVTGVYLADKTSNKIGNQIINSKPTLCLNQRFLQDHKNI